ncbi:MAG: hypothetical protein R2848_19775 [Thermomicrobiales bacterium]
MVSSDKSNSDPDAILRRAVERRAPEAASWGIAAVNWEPTDSESAFEVLFRFYGPTEALFEKKWSMADPQISQ